MMEAHGEKVELFERRMDSDCIPSQSAKVMNITGQLLTCLGCDLGKSAWNTVCLFIL